MFGELFGLTLLVLGVFVASSPSLLVWALLKLRFPSYFYDPKPLTFTCVVLAFLTGYALGLSFDLGILTAFFLVLVISLLWTLMLAPLIYSIKYWLLRNT